jgi:hypothetical protein
MRTDITILRVMVNEPTTDNYSDDDLQQVLDDQGGDLDAAALNVWEEKAARFSILFNNGNRSLQQMFANAKSMADYYQKKVGAADSRQPQVGRPTIGQITRV